LIALVSLVLVRQHELHGSCRTACADVSAGCGQIAAVGAAGAGLRVGSQPANPAAHWANARRDALSCGRIVGRGGLVATLRRRSVGPGGTAKLAREAAGAAASAVDAVAAVAAVAECRLVEYAE
jgi:hypothetical protein